MRLIICIGVTVLVGWCPASAQHPAFSVDHVQDEMIGVFLPRIAVAPDGSYGIAAEALFRTPSGREVLRVLGQRYSASGDRLGPTHVFAGESCLVGLDVWLFDYQERPSVLFHPSGPMLILMQHTGELQIGTDGVRRAEITIGGIGPDGSLLNLSPYDGCVQKKLTFVNASRQDRPRFAITPAGEILVTADGFFGGADLRNVGIRVLDSNGDTLIEEIIPHTDSGSNTSFHMHPDIATNGSIVLSTWHRCPIIDNQGNAAECDVEVQFAGIGQAGLTVIGGNRRVNAGDPTGTINVYPSAAMNAAGRSVVAWADGRDGAHGEIYAQRFTVDGQPAGGNIKVSAGQGFIDSRPELAVLQDGRFMIVWTDSSSIGYRARARTYTEGGLAEGPPFELASGRLSGQPSAAPDGNDFAYIYLEAQGSSVGLASNKSPVVISAEEPLHPEHGIALVSAFPNPFVGDVQLMYRIAAAGHVAIRIFDVLGREVGRPVDTAQSAGDHRVGFDGGTLAPGLYLVEMQSGTERRTIALLRAMR